MDLGAGQGVRGSTETGTRSGSRGCWKSGLRAVCSSIQAYTDHCTGCHHRANMLLMAMMVAAAVMAVKPNMMKQRNMLVADSILMISPLDWLVRCCVDLWVVQYSDQTSFVLLVAPLELLRRNKASIVDCHSPWHAVWPSDVAARYSCLWMMCVIEQSSVAY